MSKLYLNKSYKKQLINDIKNLKNEKNIGETNNHRYFITKNTLYIKKKHIKHYEIILIFLPKVLTNIVLEYLNDNIKIKYKITYEAPSFHNRPYNPYYFFRIEIYYLPQKYFTVTYEIDDTTCPRYSIYIPNNPDIITFDKKVIALDINSFFNSFMHKYYNKKRYIKINNENQHYNHKYIYTSTEKQKRIHIINKKLLKNIIVIIKILIDIFFKYRKC